MSGFVYGKIDEFLNKHLSEMNLYIQEGSGGYYISSRENGDYNSGTFVNRLAQIVEDGDEFRLSIKDGRSGEWGEYEEFYDLESCLNSMASYLNGNEEPPIGKDKTMFEESVGAIEFKCWVCDTVLFKAESTDGNVNVKWTEGLNSIEMKCPNCSRVILFDLTSEDDISAVLAEDINNRYRNSEFFPEDVGIQPDNKPSFGKDIGIKIDFHDLVWRLKDHSNSSVHYLNTLTGRLERVSIRDLEDRGMKREYERSPWLRILPVPSKEAFGAMEDFIDRVEDGNVREGLKDAISGSKPFKKFKSLLQNYPDLIDKWTSCENDFYMKRSREWLKENGIKYEFI